MPSTSALHAARSAAPVVVLLLLAAGGCTSDSATPRAPDSAQQRGATNVINGTRHGTLRAFGHDTLSSQARILTIVPASTGDDVAFTFTDPARGIGTGLGIIGHDDTSPQLLWPDSVTDVWWTGARSLAFTSQTGDGARMIVDVRAESLTVSAVGKTAGSGRPAGTDTADAATAAMRSRARAFVDSLHPVPPGTRQPALRWSVASLTPAPGGRAAAFYVVATDSTGQRTNPSWYVLDGVGAAGRITSIDSITGAVDNLPANAAAWGGPNRFYYARGLTLWEAHLKAH